MFLSLSLYPGKFLLTVTEHMLTTNFSGLEKKDI
jgi:hypothetical protein